jgi:hypothetical protein
LVPLSLAAVFIPFGLVAAAGAADLGVRVVAGVGAVLALFLVALTFLAWLGRLPAQLIIEGDGLAVRYALGLRRRRVRLPPRRVAVGSLIERRRSTVAGHLENSPGWDARFGTYLRIEGEGGAITVGCRSYGFGARAQERGWTSGGRRRRWDITVDRKAMVALEYRLLA